MFPPTAKQRLRSFPVICKFEGEVACHCPWRFYRTPLALGKSRRQAPARPQTALPLQRHLLCSAPPCLAQPQEAGGDAAGRGGAEVGAGASALPPPACLLRPPRAGRWRTCSWSSRPAPARRTRKAAPCSCWASCRTCTACPGPTCAASCSRGSPRR